MSSPATLPPLPETGAANPPGKKKWSVLLPPSLSSGIRREEPVSPVEQFYLQKQVQQKTLMAFVLEDGERIDGHIEWYDRLSLKIRGRKRVLIYKSAIKYMYKLDELTS